MVRKRDAWTRARDSFRKRRKSRAPKTGWVITELAALTGQSPRTIRYYLQQGVLSRPPFFGTATRYGREHLLRLLGVERLKREGLRKLSVIKQRLDAAGDAELLAAVAAQPPSAAVTAASSLRRRARGRLPAARIRAARAEKRRARRGDGSRCCRVSSCCSRRTRALPCVTWLCRFERTVRRAEERSFAGLGRAVPAGSRRARRRTTLRTWMSPPSTST